MPRRTKEVSTLESSVDSLARIAQANRSLGKLTFSVGHKRKRNMVYAHAEGCSREGRGIVEAPFAKGAEEEEETRFRRAEKRLL